MRRLVVGLSLAFVASAVLGRALAEEPAPPAWEAARSTFQSRINSTDPKEKQRAFESLRNRPEAQALEVLLTGYRKVRAEGDQVRNKQEQAEREYEALVKRLIEAQRKISQGQQGPREIEAFNKTEKKLSAEIDAKRLLAKNLENEWGRNRALLDSATDVAASVLSAMPPERGQEALVALRAAWLEGNDPEGPLRWRDTLTSAHSAAVPNELLKVLAEERIPTKGRVAALEVLGDRRERTALEATVALLKRPPEEFALVTAAVGTLRRLHDRRAIPPLIEFLRREDLGRLREDARDALVSLTGQEHGPYVQPWEAWWKEAEATFAMPPSPYAPPPVAPGKMSKTFYGIHTFSDRVLYIVDLSESMTWAPGKRGVPGGEDAKIVRLREELTGAVSTLDDGAIFNVIVFNHEVIPWQPGVVTANDNTKRKLANWINKEITPTGLTNIHDALEAGFRLILQTTGRPPFDTIFFLTDGKPTGGKLTDPELILDAVRDWNSVANTTIHVIGIGHGEDIDEGFLQKLADIGHGKYIQRSD